MKLPAAPRRLRVFLSGANLVWREWNIQSMVLTSFIMHVVLVFLAPFRKRSSNRVILFTVWLFFLLIDWIAIHGIGVISNPCISTAAGVENELHAFWAQILLLFLGGPDSIVALALEDGELWLRTGLYLAVQIYSGLGILVRTMAHGESRLWLISLLMFSVGISRYSERISTLYHGRLIRLWLHKTKTIIDLWPDDDVEETNAQLLHNAFYFFHKFKGFYAGHEYGIDDPENMALYLSSRTPEKVFQSLEIQFNFAYEFFYTKTVLFTSSFWKAIRHVSTLFLVACLLIWSLFTDKQGLEVHNVLITYTVLICTVAHDVYSFLNIQLWSIWAIAQSSKYATSKLPSFYNIRLSPRKRIWGRYKGWRI